jgi:hypothetical protein
MRQHTPGRSLVRWVAAATTKYTHGKDFRDALMSGVEAMKRYGANKWLSDDRKNPVLNSDDRQWGSWASR